MKVSYQHANPRGGNESYYIKFTDEVDNRTMCILVDSGEGVSVRDDLSDDEYLGAILLTHPHGDHYASLASNIVDGATVYSSPDTERVLETILQETSKYDDIGDPQVVTESLTAITKWTPLWGDVEVLPVPAGHCPGAVAFIIRFGNEGDRRHIMASGDFTFNPVAGNPGLPLQYPFEIDALFINAPVCRDHAFDETVGDIVSTTIKRQLGGGKTLVTASGLAGVHIAYLLGHVGETIGQEFDIIVAGHLAKLYDDLRYDVPGVSTVPNFGDPSHLVQEGGICIAGPSVPKNNAAGRIFDQIRDDPSANLIQVLSGTSHEPVESATCGVYSFQYMAHPVQDEIDEFVEKVLPRQLVIEHGRTHAYGDRYDFTITWSNRDFDEYTLFENGYWCSPGWITEDANKSIRANHTRRKDERVGAAASVGEGLELPLPARMDTPQLLAEGVSQDTLEPRAIQQSSSDKSTSKVDGSQERPDPQRGESAETREADVDDEVLASIDERLSSIEQSLDGQLVNATVIDLQDGSVALKITDDEIADLVSHGETLTVRLDID